MEEKKKYEKPTFEIVIEKTENIIMTSGLTGTGNGNDKDYNLTEEDQLDQ